MDEKYYYCEKDNKAIRIRQGMLVYFQIKLYENGEIRHSYGMMPLPVPGGQLDEILKDFKESTNAIYLSVVKQYYSKEKENMEIARKLLFKK